MKLWCCGCGTTIAARLTNGTEVYPARPDLADVPRWICDGCGNSIGTHHKSKKPLRPLGCIPTPEIAKERTRLHHSLDVIWQFGLMKRAECYRWLSQALGGPFHIGELKTLEDCQRASTAIRDLTKLVSGSSRPISPETPLSRHNRR